MTRLLQEASLGPLSENGEIFVAIAWVVAAAIAVLVILALIKYLRTRNTDRR